MIRYFLGVMVVITLLTSNPRPPLASFKFDQSQSKIAVTIFEDGFLRRMRPSHAIEVRSFTGSVNYTPGREGESSAELIAEARSLANAEKEIGETERREFENALRNSVLEVEKYPQITFRSTSIGDIKGRGNNLTFTLTGDLTMHGVKRQIGVPVTVVVAGKQLTATGEVNFKQTDYQMKPYEAALGLIKIRDQVNVKFSIVARTP